ncbi:MAG: hypothetical protein HY000_33635, partial [Planctomycetes bacterium]|nr:hypothetical protein [Planctomycetota bacterium]
MAARAPRLIRPAWRAVVAAGLLAFWAAPLRAAGDGADAPSAAHEPITIAADRIQRWQEDRYAALILRGRCYI